MSVLNEQEVIEQLQYIADSPAQEYGGFHPNAVKAAKDGIVYIAQQKADFQKQKQEMWDEYKRIQTEMIADDSAVPVRLLEEWQHKWEIV